jgi:hypothetical protein
MSSTYDSISQALDTSKFRETEHFILNWLMVKNLMEFTEGKA